MACPCLACRKTPSGFSAKLLQSAARTPCAPLAHNSHTCSPRCILCQVHALTQNDLDFVFRLRGKFCEAFLTVWEWAGQWPAHVFCAYGASVRFVLSPADFCFSVLDTPTFSCYNPSHIKHNALKRKKQFPSPVQRAAGRCEAVTEDAVYWPLSGLSESCASRKDGARPIQRETVVGPS